MAIEVVPTGAALGAEIRGVDLAEKLSDAEAADIGIAAGAPVIVVASSEEKRRILSGRGVDAAIGPEGFRERVEELTGGAGVDVVYDPVGGAVTRPSISCLRPGGRLVTIGFAGGDIPSVALNVLLVKNVSVMGFNWGEYVGWGPVDRRTEFSAPVADMMRTLTEWWQAGNIAPIVHARFDLADFAKAMAEVRGRRAIGRVVLTP